MDSTQIAQDIIERTFSTDIDECLTRVYSKKYEQFLEDLALAFYHESDNKLTVVSDIVSNDEKLFKLIKSLLSNRADFKSWEEDIKAQDDIRDHISDDMHRLLIPYFKSDIEEAITDAYYEHRDMLTHERNFNDSWGEVYVSL